MVSIIIPVYNAEKCLHKCVKSVLSQTYNEWECVLVNDGSKDKSFKICEDYVQKDSRFVVVNKKNEGVDKARFAGLQNSLGEFVMFLDADDWLEKNAIEQLMSIVHAMDVDVVVGMIRCVYCLGPIKISDKRRKVHECVNKLISHNELMDDYYISFFGVNILPVSMCATLYRRSTIDVAQLAPSGLFFGEDLVFNMKLMPYVQKYYMTDKTVYYYRRDGWGSSSKYLDNWLKNARLLFDTKMSQINDLNYSKALKWQLIEYMNYLKTYVNNCLLHDMRNLTDRIDALEKEFRRYKYGEKLKILSAMGYKDEEIMDVVCKMDAKKFFSIMHSRLLRQNIWYRIRNKSKQI